MVRCKGEIGNVKENNGFKSKVNTLLIVEKWFRNNALPLFCHVSRPTFGTMDEVENGSGWTGC